nr:uncharacterized protein LOC128696403 [Cherax quadricarinatus]
MDDIASRLDIMKGKPVALGDKDSNRDSVGAEISRKRKEKGGVSKLCYTNSRSARSEMDDLRLVASADNLIHRVDRKFKYTVRTKSTNVSSYIHYYSRHESRVNRSVFLTMFMRILRICRLKYLEDEINKIFNIATKLRYLGDFVEKALFGCHIRHLSSPRTSDSAYSSILGAFYDPLNAYVYYVVCNGKGWWQSGAKGQMSQCLNGTWSTITDKCIEPSGTAGNASTTAQPVTTASSTAARDCAEIAMMGHSISGIYSIIPSGNSSDSDMKVMCTLSSDPGDSGWTQVLYLSLPTIIPIVINAGDVMGTPGSGTFYFIGFNALTSLNWNITTLQNTSRPLVFLVELVKADGTTLYATYNAVVIARDNYYTLQNVGDYHGNAGDMLRHSKLHGIAGSSSLLWSCDSPQTCEKVCGSVANWGSLSFVQVTISVRPSTYDALYACPAVMSFDPTWPSTTVIQMTASRSVGAIVSYTCTDGLIEGNATVGYSTTGSAKCLPKTLTWSMIPVLPCNLVCPVGYTMINDTCVYASSQVPELGLVSASLECHQSNSSLINVTSVDQLSVATPGTFYYTAHIYTSSAGFVSQPPAFTCAVGETCAGGLGLECLAMTVSGNQIVARSQNCYRNDTFALCAVPDYCPNNFTAYRGLCYKVVSQYNPIYSFSSALSYCNSLGAALAYPETLDVIDFLVEFVRQSVTSLTGEVYVLTGYNTRLDPTMGGIYNPSPEVIDIPLEVSGYADRILAINPLNYTVYSDNMTSSLPVNYAVCQMYGPKGGLWMSDVLALWSQRRFVNVSCVLALVPKLSCDCQLWVNSVVRKMLAVSALWLQRRVMEIIRGSLKSKS